MLRTVKVKHFTGDYRADCELQFGVNVPFGFSNDSIDFYNFGGTLHLYIFMDELAKIMSEL